VWEIPARAFRIANMMMKFSVDITGPLHSVHVFYFCALHSRLLQVYINR